MISIPGASLNGRFRVVLVAATSVFLFFVLYNFIDYGSVPLAEAQRPHERPYGQSDYVAPVVLTEDENAFVEVSSVAQGHVQSSTPTPTPTLSSSSTFSALASEISPAPLGAIIAASMHTTNTTWMHKLSDSWTLYPYVADNPFPPPELEIPRNKGHEAMVYLTFIINHWDALPPRMIFVHGHRTSWHQENDTVSLIRSLRLPALEEVGYIPLRCDWYPSCPAEIRPITHDAVVWGPGVHREDAENGIAEAWETLFPGVPIPETIASQCCAQFAVSRAAVQRRQKADYERVREWLMETELEDDVSGRVLEKLWAYIMTEDAVRCPAPQECACDYFGICAVRGWPEPPEGLARWPER
ncbi:hypothetical protein K432DRAFT_398387 [Lepidopterella palustris CBS 459.81]|uniref:Uncharacterized protein n=1 Tax=Lepidopterella palustris CBS 459.81 TaxID=1314670 RepID=A0A8E2J9A5_9PEZI|nr:hypothetical protein K432DRAFT_398387 [Lepidopterella palustris CBS 459.81]